MSQSTDFCTDVQCATVPMWSQFSHLSPGGIWRSNSGQAWQKAPLPAGPLTSPNLDNFYRLSSGSVASFTSAYRPLEGDIPLFFIYFSLLFLYLLQSPSVSIFSTSTFSILTVLALNALPPHRSNICAVCGSVSILILGNKTVSLLFLLSQSAL